MPIYLDNGATSYPKPESVLHAMDAYARNVGGSAGRSVHAKALAGDRVLSETRELIARLVHCGFPERVILTKNATEGLNLAILGALRPGDEAVCSVVDHNSVLRPLRHLEQALGVRVTRVPCDRHGRIDMDAMAHAIGRRPRLVVTTHASNVTGAVQDVESIARLCRKNGALFCLDCAQTGGVVAIDMTMGIDFVALTGHKSLFGPTGTGALVLSEAGAQIPGRMFGGTGTQSEQDVHPEFLPDRFEAGTPNTHGNAGLMAGLQFVMETGIERIHGRESALRAQLIEGLCCLDRLTLFGNDNGLATSAISFTDGRIYPSDFAFMLDQKYGIQVRAGLHCAPLFHRAIKAMPYGTVRLTPGYFTTEDEIETTIRAIREILSHG